LEVLLSTSLESESPEAAFSEICKHFQTLYKKEYGYNLHMAIELVGVHVTGFAETNKLRPSPVPKLGKSLEETKKGSREVDFFDFGRLSAAVYDMNSVEPGMEIPGPAIIENEYSSAIVFPETTASIDPYGNICIVWYFFGLTDF
jgi:N-methylhydantoinase A